MGVRVSLMLVTRVVPYFDDRLPERSALGGATSGQGSGVRVQEVIGDRVISDQ
jgi:hypothetical protein